MPKPKSLAGRIAFVTGGAGGIGAATAERLLARGRLRGARRHRRRRRWPRPRAALAGRHSADVVRTVEMNVTSEEAVAAAYAEMAVEFGGVDILVSNAGIASSAPVEDTTLDALEPQHGDPLDRLFPGLARGVPAAEGAGDRRRRSSSSPRRTASPPRPSAAAYCTAKAAEIHLARCLALEGAPEGIRVNVVNPDAVLRGSKIWTGEWREQRAADLQDRQGGAGGDYRQRSLLKRSVCPEDIAEAIYFLASDASAKSTGNIINVDAGNAQAFTR